MGDLGAPEHVQEIIPGLKLGWYFDRHIVVYELTKVTPDLLKLWSETVLSTLKAWPKERPYLAMHDLSAPGVATIYAALTKYDMLNIGVTSEGRVRAEAILNKYLNLQARVVITFNLTLSGHIGKTLLNTYLDKHPAVQYKSFYGKDASMRWLASHLDASVANG